MDIVTASLIEHAIGPNAFGANGSRPNGDKTYKVQQSVDADGQPVKQRIDGVVVRAATTIADERGSICEVYRPSWGVHDEPLVFVYQVVIRPGETKGWQVHRKQDDRIFTAHGHLQVVLYDDRPGSPTFGVVNEFNVGEQNRALVVIPKGVWHAMRNVGQSDATFVNMPTQPYNYEDPDKYRIPLDSDLIPYTWRKGGW